MNLDRDGSSEESIGTVQSLHKLELQRRANRDGVRGLGLNPYGTRRDGLIDLARARSRYDAAADGAHAAAGKTPPAGYQDRRPVVSVSGRVTLLRDNGRLVWISLRDHTGDLQVAASKADCVPAGFELAKLTDLGDVVIATGRLMRTKTGEITVWASDLVPAAKCLFPPPEKHAGLTDVELRYRRRYIDLWANPDSMRVMKLRSKLVARVRRFLDERDFLEVETPTLQQLAGGAAARPFITHMNALSIDLFLRIAPELYLKRLLVGGLPRVYEVSRNFRNEGLDKSHNPEFTSLEVYQAFGDYGTMMELAESLVRELARLAVIEAQDRGASPGGEASRAAEQDAIPGQMDPLELKIPFGEFVIDYGSPFVRVTYAELFERALGFAMTDEAGVRRAVREHEDRHRGATTTGGGKPGGPPRSETADHWLLVNELFEELAEPLIDPARPTFVLDYPAAISPLTRPSQANPSIAERWDLFIGGMEIGPAYTELNDPDVQEEKFREQLAGIDDEETTFRTFDQDFIDALKVGMPPAGGLGLGIDRLTMLLSGQRTIRDVMLFPMMKPME